MDTQLQVTGVSTTYVTSSGSVESFSGYIKGLVTKVNVGSIDVKIVSKYDNSTGTHSDADYSENGLNRIPDGSSGVYLQLLIV